MPIQFGVGEALELLKYGKFNLLTLSGMIPKAEAVIIDKIPYTTTPPAVDVRYYIEDGWLVLTERFNWGETSRPDKVYYELHQFGKKTVEEVSPFTAWVEGFYCGSKVKGSNIDNLCTHLFATDEIHVKLWNSTKESPEDVYYDFTLWYYTFLDSQFEQVLNVLLKTPRTLQRIEELLKKPVEYPTVDLSKVEALLAQIKSLLQRPPLKREPYKQAEFLE